MITDFAILGLAHRSMASARKKANQVVDAASFARSRPCASSWLMAAILFLGATVGLVAQGWAQTLPDDIDISGSANGVVVLPPSVDAVFTDIFERYTKIVAPNGGAIHILIEDQVTDEMAVRAREVMGFFLTAVPGSEYGASKVALANSMANLNAALVYFNSEESAQQALEGALGNADFFGQDLYATESVVEGSSAYLNNTTRDATLEEVFHLVHGAGIQPVLPSYHAELTAAKNAAKAAGDWTPASGLPAQDEVFEYIISVIDVYYGFWAHNPDGDGSSFGGEYAFHTRAAVQAGDPGGVTSMRKFLPEYFVADLHCAASFNGTFTLTFDAMADYTLKSQYLRDLSLDGSNPSTLIGNGLDNILQGNIGDNLLDGRDGFDIARYQGDLIEYTIEDQGGSFLVFDQIGGRDGSDTVVNIERLEFADQSLTIASSIFADGFESGNAAAWTVAIP